MTERMCEEDIRAFRDSLPPEIASKPCAMTDCDGPMTRLLRLDASDGVKFLLTLCAPHYEYMLERVATEKGFGGVRYLYELAPDGAKESREQ